MDKLITLQKPDPREAANKLLNGNISGKVVTAHVNCTVTYEGRAASTIEEGERIIIVKPDGTLLVHGDENYQPINWQSSGAEISADISEEGHLQVIGETDEYLEITCLEIYQLTVFNNKDSAELQLEGTEEEMHQRILENPEVIEDGLTNLEHEKKFSFGRVDVFAKDSSGRPVIIEVKRRPATRDHVYQLYTYVMEYNQVSSTTARGILVAPTCTEYIHEVLDSYDLEYAQLDPVEND